MLTQLVRLQAAKSWLSAMKIGFIGLGKMATAIIKGLEKTDFDLLVTGRDPQKTARQAEQLGVRALAKQTDLVAEADLIILGVKPQVLPTVLEPLDFHQPIISMAAGVSLRRLAELTDPSLPLIRIMPNINAQILQSTTAICANQYVDEEVWDLATTITDCFGSTFAIAEKDFDTFTALAGSSPAYIYLFMEALALAGVKHGFPKDQALSIVTQTVLASAQNLSQGQESPHDLIDKIASPGGTTIAGLADLEKTGLTASAISSIDATIARAKEL